MWCVCAPGAPSPSVPLPLSVAQSPTYRRRGRLQAIVVWRCGVAGGGCFLLGCCAVRLRRCSSRRSHASSSGHGTAAELPAPLWFGCLVAGDAVVSWVAARFCAAAFPLGRAIAPAFGPWNGGGASRSARVWLFSGRRCSRLLLPDIAPPKNSAAGGAILAPGALFG